MRRTAHLVLGVTASALFFAACSDSTVAPHASLAPVELRVPPVSFTELQAAPGGVSFAVTIDPRRDNVYSDGINTVRFPAGSICDPATSSYGPGTWDQPCTPATSAITLPITLSITGSRMHVEFGKALRFVPSTDPARQVVLTMVSPSVAYTTEDLAKYAIFYVPESAPQLVDEGAADRSLVTIIDRSQGTLSRRLKHFSGYNVHLGIWDDCQPGIDDGCYTSEPGVIQVK